VPERIRVLVCGVTLEGELGDTETARALAEALPIEADVSTWGEEYYFGVPLERELDETATTAVEVGDLGYWPPGRALALFFGRTPASGPDGRPVPASEVSLVGRVEGAGRLREAEGADRIRIERL
jgi:hypothetical protein